jgi:hypothetical protein
MKEKLSRTARVWTLTLLLLSGVLLAMLVWTATTPSGARSSATGNQPSESEKSVDEESHAVETVQPPSSRKGFVLPERGVARQETPAVQAGPRLVAPAPAADPTPAEAAQARLGVANGVRSLSAQAPRPADAGRAGTN